MLLLSHKVVCQLNRAGSTHSFRSVSCNGQIRWEITFHSGRPSIAKISVRGIRTGGQEPRVALAEKTVQTARIWKERKVQEQRGTSRNPLGDGTCQRVDGFRCALHMVSLSLAERCCENGRHNQKLARFLQTACVYL